MGFKNEKKYANINNYKQMTNTQNNDELTSINNKMSKLAQKENFSRKDTILWKELNAQKLLILYGKTNNKKTTLKFKKSVDIRSIKPIDIGYIMSQNDDRKFGKGKYHN